MSWPSGLKQTSLTQSLCPFRIFISSPSRDQSLIVLSALAEAMSWPSGLKVTLLTLPVCFVKRLVSSIAEYICRRLFVVSSLSSFSPSRIFSLSRNVLPASTLVDNASSWSLSKNKAQAFELSWTIFWLVIAFLSSVSGLRSFIASSVKWLSRLNIFWTNSIRVSLANW